MKIFFNGILLVPLLAKATIQPGSTLLETDQIDVVEALLASVELAAEAVDRIRRIVPTNETSNQCSKGSGWFDCKWLEAGSCLRSNYRHLNATCTLEQKKDVGDPCGLYTPDIRPFVDPLFYSRLVNSSHLVRTSRILDLADVAFKKLLNKRFSGHGMPAIVHQTWKSKDVQDEIDFKIQMDAWQDHKWTHLIWNDNQLNRLLNAIFPWFTPTMRKMRKPVDKIDCMRYILLFLFGGVYLDADQLRVHGGLDHLFREVPLRGLAAGTDPAVIASHPRHLMLVQMLVWIVSRVRQQLFGGRHELTGPEGWRRVLSAYRQCEDQEFASQEHRWPTILFNQHQCGCWGTEVEGDIAEVNATVMSARVKGGLVYSRDVPIRSDSPRITSVVRVNTNIVGYNRWTDSNDGKQVVASDFCVGFHRCSRIYGNGIQDWDGGVALGNGVPLRRT